MLALRGIGKNTAKDLRGNARKRDNSAALQPELQQREAWLMYGLTVLLRNGDSCSANTHRKHVQRKVQNKAGMQKKKKHERDLALF